MKELQILFNTEMVRAILGGRKTQTRRPVKYCVHSKILASEISQFFRSPFGSPGDQLWVRETWKYWDWTEDGEPWVIYRADGRQRLCDYPEEDSEKIEDVWAKLSDPDNYIIDGFARDRKWRPSIHMPRWASRIDLLVKRVWIERLQDISEQDAVAEGKKPFFDADDPHFETAPNGSKLETHPLKGPIDALHKSWDQIYSKRGFGWDKNPWVWCCEFEREE